MGGLNSWAAAHLGLLLILLAGAAIAALALTSWLAFRLHEVQRHYAVLTEGTDGGNLHQVLEAHAEAVRATGGQIEELNAIVRRLEQGATLHLQRLGVVRFNPFRDAGGDQSFSLAIADANGDGMVISSLHGREGSRVYGKPLVKWSSAYPLTDEEREAIKRAKTASLKESAA